MNKSIKSGSSSPVKTNRSNAKNISFGSPTCKTAATSHASPVAKVFNVTLVRSPITHTNKTKQRDGQSISIYHEAKMVQNIIANQATKVQQPKRDPILQNNGEAPGYQRPQRRPQSAERARPSESRDELIRRSKFVGEYNHVYNPRPEDPKPEGIRVFQYLPSESADETWRRCSKTVRGKSETRRNPITEGEVNIFKRQKKAGEEMTEQKEYNDKKYLLPAQRGASANGRLFRTKSCLTFNEYDDFSSVKTDRSSTPSRAMTPMQMKMRGFAKGVLEYEDGPNYRDQGVTHKVGTIKFSDLAHAGERDRIFARKATLGL